MTHEHQAFKEKIKKRAITLEIGGFKPPEDHMSSWFGKVSFCKQGEVWPLHDGQPMAALAQINLSEIPYKPKGLEGLEFIAIFIANDELPLDTPNGNGWLLRSYKSTDELIPLEKVEINSHIRPFPMRPKIIEADYPCWDDVAFKCPESLENEYYDHFKTVEDYVKDSVD